MIDPLSMKYVFATGESTLLNASEKSTCVVVNPARDFFAAAVKLGNTNKMNIDTIDRDMIVSDSALLRTRKLCEDFIFLFLGNLAIGDGEPDLIEKILDC